MADINSEIDRLGNNGTSEPRQLDTTVYKKDIAMTTGEQRSYAAGPGDVVVDRARDATLAEHTLTVREAFRLYRPAIGWSFLFSLGVIMAGFDVSTHLIRIWTACKNADRSLFSRNLLELLSPFLLSKKTLVRHTMAPTSYQPSGNQRSILACL